MPFKIFWSGLLMLTPAVPGAVWPAAPPLTPAPLAVPAEEQLDEVVVEGRRIRPRAQDSFNWLARLVGEFTIDGDVDPAPEDTAGELLRVQGQASCYGFGIGPGVVCELRARWPGPGPDGKEFPGSVSTLDPAVMLFGFEMGAQASENQYSIQNILVDSKGVAESSTGLAGGANTYVFRSSCGAIAGNCERVTRISVRDLQTVEMQMELQIDRAQAAHYRFVLRRVPDSEAVVYGRKPVNEDKKRR